MSSCSYKPSSSTEDLAHIQSAVSTSQTCVGGFGMGAYGNVRQYPFDCGYTVFVAKQPGPGFAGTLFEDTTTWVKPHLSGVSLATSQEVRSGYPQSSYVPVADAISLPPNYVLCNQ